MPRSESENRSLLWRQTVPYLFCAPQNNLYQIIFCQVNNSCRYAHIFKNCSEKFIVLPPRMLETQGTLLPSMTPNKYGTSHWNHLNHWFCASPKTTRFVPNFQEWLFVHRKLLSPFFCYLKAPGPLAPFRAELTLSLASPSPFSLSNGFLLM